MTKKSRIIDGIPLLSSNFSNDTLSSNNDSEFDSPTITSSLINSIEQPSSSSSTSPIPDLNYNTININKNSSTNINITQNHHHDNPLTLFYNQSMLHNNYYTDCRVLIITSEKDIIRITLDELLLLIKKIKKLDPTLSNSIPSSSEEEEDEDEELTEKLNIIVNEYFNNLEKCFWIDIYGLQDDELITLCKALDIHHLNVDDILSNDTTEKCESYDNYFFIVTSEMARLSNHSNSKNNTHNHHYRKKNNNNINDTVNELKENFFNMFLFKRIIFVLHSNELDSFTDVIKSFRYLKNDKKILVSSEWILCNFMDSINELISLESERMMKEVDQLDEFCNLKEEYDYDYDYDDDDDNHGGDDIEYSELYIRIGKASKRNTNLLSNLFNKDVLLSSLSRQPLFSNDTKQSIYHTIMKSKRLKDRIKLCEELLEGIHTTYINKVSLLLNEESHALTVSMKKFANYSLIAMPLTLIATMFGMNIRIPGMVNFLEENESGFIYLYIILISMLIIGILTSYLYKKIGWLD